MITAVVTGLPEIDAKLQRMYLKDANKLARAVLKTGIERTAYNIRLHIPKSITPKAPDKGIGTSMKRGAKGPQAKAGTGVGRSQRNALPMGSRGRRKGVGVSARNLHWFAVGTVNRYTGSKRNRSKGASKGARVSTGNPRKSTGRLRKEKFGQFVRKWDEADVRAHMEARFLALYQKMGTAEIEST